MLTYSEGVFALQISTSIPVFLRHGPTKVNFSVSGAKITNDSDKTFLEYTILNESTRSLYGNVELACALSSEGDVQIESLGGIRLYAEAKRLNIKQEIKKINVNTCSSITVKVFGRADKDYLNKILAEYEVGMF